MSASAFRRQATKAGSSPRSPPTAAYARLAPRSIPEAAHLLTESKSMPRAARTAPLVSSRSTRRFRRAPFSSSQAQTSLRPFSSTFRATSRSPLTPTARSSFSSNPTSPLSCAVPRQLTPSPPGAPPTLHLSPLTTRHSSLVTRHSHWSPTPMCSPAFPAGSRSMRRRPLRRRFPSTRRA